jgi:hypothetical protein
MRTFLKTLSSLLVVAIVCAIGCTKPNNDDNGNGNNNNENPGGGASGPDVVVTTFLPSDITTSSAVCGGSVEVIQGLSLTKVGVCWSTSPNPTADDNQLSSETWNEPFNKTISGLSPNTTYHVRAFALRGLEYYYGEDKSFTTLSDGGGGGGGTTPTLPSVFTLYVDNVTQTSMQGGGNVTSDGGATVTERGLCWSVSSNPTISDSHMNSGGGTGEFWLSITGLAANTTYHLRAYATNSVGTNYGNEVIFTTEGSTSWPNGVLPGVFSVSETKRVQFSQGNLQYKASISEWRFADNQYDYVGNDNRFISQNYNGYIDLFGWGTSGWDNGNKYYKPWDIESSDELFNEGYGPIYYVGDFLMESDLTGNYSEADWGFHNPISNGGNMVHQWRTLTQQEWDYVIFNRNTPSGIRFAKAQLNYVKGLVLLPDDWTLSTYALNSVNQEEASYNSNIISHSQWNELEARGCVFCPITGLRENVTVLYLNEGSYWSSTRDSFPFTGWACSIIFRDDKLFTDGHSARSLGCAVRLVKDYQ